MELTIHTGCIREECKLNIAWFDENGVEQKTVLEVKVKNQDKPRTLEIICKGIKLAEVLRNSG